MFVQKKTLALVVVVTAACSSGNDYAPPASGGATNGAGGVSPGAGGATAASGTPGTGGALGVGGGSFSTGGAMAAAGGGASGGATSTGGADGTGGTGGAGGGPSSGGVDGSGGAPVGPVPPGDSTAPGNNSKWAANGSFQVDVVSRSGPTGTFTLFVPSPLGQGGLSHPIVTWGNGVTTTSANYTALLSTIASHGIFVVASNSTSVASTTEMPDGMKWAVAENTRSGGPYAGKLNTSKIGSVGYSNGGIAAVRTSAQNDAMVTCTIVIAGGDATINKITRPILLIGNATDGLVDPASLLQPQYDSVTLAPIVYGVASGTNHLTTIGNGGIHRGYVVAWLAYHLLDQTDAYRVFYGDENCTMCKDAAWKVLRKNLPR